VKHLFYAFYVSFYAGAMFVAGLFVGQFMERRWAAHEETEATEAARSVAADPLALDEAPVALSGNSSLSSR
jgi:hypothetical protein